MAPRPILKAMPELCVAPSTSSPLPFASCPQILHSPHVHFPPTPSLSSTEITHSPFAYDRAPIAVSPNACAIPERGGRKCNTPRRVARRIPHEASKGSYFHPRAFEVCERESPVELPRSPLSAHDYFNDHPPSLIPDLSSSESDDSDICMSPPVTSPIPYRSVHIAQHTSYTQHHHIPHISSQDEIEAALAFLPHPPSPVKDKERERRRKCRDSGRDRERVLKRSSSFVEPALEGCLGGF